jgi:hypothetical protein
MSQIVQALIADVKFKFMFICYAYVDFINKIAPIQTTNKANRSGYGKYRLFSFKRILFCYSLIHHIYIECRLNIRHTLKDRVYTGDQKWG